MVLQNSMDLLQGEPGSCDETGVTSALDGNEVIGVEAERVSEVSEVADQETVTTLAVMTEPNVSCVPLVSVMYIFISYVQNCLLLYQCFHMK
jgi:hypothetical protein